MGFSKYVKRKTIVPSRNQEHAATFNLECTDAPSAEDAERLKAEVANAAPAVTGAKARIAVRSGSLQHYVLGRVVIACTRLSGAVAHLPCGHDPSHSSKHEDETRAPLPAHDANSTHSKCDDGERERRPGRAVKSQRLRVSWINGCHKRNAA
jgi:hypothetical protein